MRLPFIIRRLKSTHFAADGQRGWAVGFYGTILRTQDGGGTWAPQTRVTADTLYSVSFAADGQRGWAVGTNGIVVQTLDGGATRAAQTSVGLSPRGWLAISKTPKPRHLW